MIKLFKHSLLLLFIISFCSCEQKKEQKRSFIPSPEGIKIKIDQSSGDLYKAITFLPLPVNVGKFEHIPTYELECWIISKRIKRNKKTNINMFALLEYNDGELKKNIILATANNTKYKTIECTDLMDFSLNHSGIKNILESWLKNYKGTKSNISIQWKDKQEALRYLQKYTKLNNTK